MLRVKLILALITTSLLFSLGGCNILSSVIITHDNITIFSKNKHEVDSFTLSIDVQNFKNNQEIIIRIIVLSNLVAEALGESEFTFIETSLPYKRVYHFSKSFKLKGGLDKSELINSIQIVIEDIEGGLQQSKIIENISEENY